MSSYLQRVGGPVYPLESLVLFDLFLTEMSKERFAQRSVCTCVCCWLSGREVYVGAQCLAHWDAFTKDFDVSGSV